MEFFNVFGLGTVVSIVFWCAIVLGIAFVALIVSAYKNNSLKKKCAAVVLGALVIACLLIVSGKLADQILSGNHEIASGSFTCSNCEEYVSDTDKFCSECGYALSTN